MRSLALLIALLYVLAWSDDITGPVLYSYIPSYGNMTTIRFYGVLYQREDDNTDFDIASFFINKTAADELNEGATEAEKQFFQRTVDPFLHWDLLSDQIVTFDLMNGTQVTTTKETSIDGKFDEFLPVQLPASTQLPAVVTYTATQPLDSLNEMGNVSILPTTGISFIADIDDVLKITEIWDPLTALENTFLRPYRSVPGMPELLAKWAILPDSGFHYATTIPIPLADALLSWIYTEYPFGSLDLRPINIFELDELLGAREDQLNRLVQTFPSRKFVLIGDTSLPDILSAYPAFGRRFPTNLACIFIRNITATYPDFSTPLVNLEESFQGIPRIQWFVFDQPSDIINVDPSSGNCHPPGIPAGQTTMSGGYGGTSTGPVSISGAGSVGMKLFYFVMLALVLVLAK
jgi:phosphatidate phosphatase APP1